MKIETRPWGRFIVLYEDKDTWLKRLIISPGQSLSLQSHENRDEHWLSNDRVHYWTEEFEGRLWPGEVLTVPAGTKHRLINPYEGEVHVLEWATGSPTESDIIRYEDNYGRT